MTRLSEAYRFGYLREIVEPEAASDQAAALVGEGPVGKGGQYVRESPTLARVPDTQDVNHAVLDFLAHFVVADEDAAHFARLEFLQALADARIGA